MTLSAASRGFSARKPQLNYVIIESMATSKTYTCTREARRSFAVHGVAFDVTMSVYVIATAARDAVVEWRHAVDERMVKLASHHFRCETSVVAVKHSQV